MDLVRLVEATELFNNIAPQAKRKGGSNLDPPFSIRFVTL
jgi:hypothetical protein